MDQSAFQKQLAALRDHRAAAPASMRQAFAADPQRFKAFSATDGDLLLDWSKCAVDAVTMDLLEKLAKAADLEGRRAAMFAGKKINVTEDRAVLHTALRNLTGKGVTVDGQDVKADVTAVLDAMGAFADAVRSGKAAGATGKKITDIVNIGIGGSDLGPAMATLALAPYHDGPRAHYVSNIDGAHIHDTLKGLSAETTLFIIASKTFTTVETMTNAQTARDWVQKALGKQAVGKHFAAVSTALDLVAKFGIESDRVFGFWDWVGGRYSVWGAIGLPVMIAVGPRNFRAFLDGAHEMDEHFRTAPTAGNLPALLGLVGWWHRVICGYPARGHPLRPAPSRLPACSSSIWNPTARAFPTAAGDADRPLVWGEPGTNGQHASSSSAPGHRLIPVEFLPRPSAMSRSQAPA